MLFSQERHCTLSFINHLQQETMKKIFSCLFSLAVLISGLSFTACQEKALEGDLILSVSSKIIVADGVDELVLTAKIGDVDITHEAAFYINNSPMSGNTFTTEKPGEYTFFASYNGNISKHVTIKAANPALYVSVPEDSQPDKFSGFSRKVLVAEGTGTWCGYCPYMIAALELFSENGSNADKAVIVATHSGDEFSNAASEAAVSAMSIKGFPSCVLNLNPEVLIQNNYPDINAEKINSTVGMELKEAARVGIAAATALSVDSTIIGVRAAVKVGKNGSYRINAWLIEDGINGYQSGAEAVISHMHILRGASCVSPIYGQLLGGKESCSAGEVMDFYYEFDTKKFDVADVKNCKVAIMVTAASGMSSKCFVNNIIECPVGEDVPFAYNN